MWSDRDTMEASRTRERPARNVNMAVDERGVARDCGMPPARREDGAAHMRLATELVALAFDLPSSAIARRDRQQGVLLARRCCLYLLHTCCGMSVRALAGGFGMSRKTVMLALRRVEDWREDAAADALLECLEEALRHAARARLVRARATCR